MTRLLRSFFFVCIFIGESVKIIAIVSISLGGHLFGNDCLFLDFRSRLEPKEPE